MAVVTKSRKPSVGEGVEELEPHVSHVIFMTAYGRKDLASRRGLRGGDSPTVFPQVSGLHLCPGAAVDPPVRGH